MGIYGGKLRLGSEHKELLKDVAWVVINYTPVSGVIHTIKFGQKWLYSKKGPHRVATYLAESDRRSFIKTRSRRIKSWSANMARV